MDGNIIFNIDLQLRWNINKLSYYDILSTIHDNKKFKIYLKIC